MVGIRIPIAVEGGKQGRKQAVSYSRRGSTSISRKPVMQRKDSRQKFKTINVEIQLEAATSFGTKEAVLTKQKDMDDGGSLELSSNRRKSMDRPRLSYSRRQSSSRDLGCLTAPSLKKSKMISRRQSSKDVLLGVIGGGSGENRRKSHGKVVIRRDSVNGLRILAQAAPVEDSENIIGEDIKEEENEALERLRSISLEEKNSSAKFANDALRAHNRYRKRHDVTPLELSAELSEKAQKYAEHLANTNTFEHSGDPVYGENLYWSWSSDPAWCLQGDEPVDSWYQERKGYNYTREPVDSESGHFTQVVWAKSAFLGVGVAKSSKTGKFFVVMKYDPAGNYIGKYRQNVKKPVNFTAKPGTR